MSLQKYKALLAAVDTGSISKAAQQLGYTQSAVSRMIADLEQEWSVELLRRSRSGIEVTSEGQQLLPVVRAIADSCADLDYTIQELHGIQTGMIRVGTFATFSDSLLPQLLRSFRDLYPNISFKVLGGESYGQIEDWIRHGQVDCGFIRAKAPADLQFHFLKRDTLSCVLPTDHPLAAMDVIPVERLKKEPLIRLKTDREISRFLDGFPVQYEVSSDNTILSMVEAGLGVSVMHGLMAAGCRHNVVWRPLDRSEQRDIGIATAKNTRLSSAARLFVEHVCKQKDDP